MYDDLIKRLRREAVYLPEKFSKNAELLDVLMKAADAIEQLSNAGSAYGRGWTLGYDAWREESKPRWIPVGERLPEEYVDVLCYCSRNGEYGCGAWHKEDKTIYWTGLDGMIPTHWMPLPPAPKEGET